MSLSSPAAAKRCAIGAGLDSDTRTRKNSPAENDNTSPYVVRQIKCREGQAAFENQAPAIVSNDYGNGHSMLFAFDLAQLLAQPGIDTKLRDLLSQTLDNLASGSATTTLGDVLALQTSASNQSARAVDVELRATLPAGIKLVSSSLVPTKTVSPTSTAAGSAVWTFTIPAGATVDLLMRLQVNRAAGDFTVPVSIYSVSSASGANPVLQDTVTHSVQQSDGAALVQTAVTAINQLSVRGSKDTQMRDRALIAAQKAQQFLAQGDAVKALAFATTAADELPSITSADKAKLAAARLAVAWSMEAIGEKICSTLSCLTRSLSLSPRDLPLGGNLSIDRKVVNQCPAAMADVTIDVLLGNRRKGDTCTQVMSDTLQIGAQPNQRQGKWKATGKDADTIDLRLRATWQGQIWNLNTDSIQLHAK